MAVKLSARERAKIRLGDFDYTEELLQKVTREIEAQDAQEAQNGAGEYNPTQQHKKPRKTPKNAIKNAIGWGGARRGAGRKPSGGEKREVWAVRVTAAEKALLLDYLLELRANEKADL